MEWYPESTKEIDMNLVRCLIYLKKVDTTGLFYVEMSPTKQKEKAVWSASWAW